MATCPSCGAQSSDDSSFCSVCGKPMSQASAPSAPAPAPTRVITPEAEMKMRQAAARAQGAVMQLGPEKGACVIGALFGILGAILPFYSIPDVSGMMDTSGVPTLSLVNGGSVGIIVILLAVALGALPLLVVPSRAMSITGFGLAAAVLGMLISDRAGYTFMGQSVAPDFGVGYYLALLGFAALAWVYGRRAYTTA